MLGTLPQVTNQDLITYFTCELPAMNHLMLPRRETLCCQRAESALSPGLCTQADYHQEHQVPGASPVTLAISVCLSSGVETPGN